MLNTPYVAQLLSLMSFQTYDRHYVPRMIYPGREEVELLLNGKAILRTAQQEFRLSPGDVIWHKPGDQTMCSDRDSHPYECLIMSFEVNPHRSLRKARVNQWVGAISARQFAEDAVRRLTEHVDDAEFAEYLYCALKVHATPTNTLETQPLSHCAATAFDKAFQFISGHFLDKNLSVATVAEAALISVSQLHTIFKQQTDLTPYQMITQCRMEHAFTLLAKNRPIKQVAAMSGFESESGFIRAFKKKYGNSPGALKKTHHFRTPLFAAAE